MRYSELTEVELIGLLQASNKLAYTEIYNRYAALVYSFTFRRTEVKQEAQDIVHEVFLFLWEKRDSLLINKGILPFMYTVVRNKILNRIKHQKVSARYIDSFQHYLDLTEENADHLLRFHELNELIEREVAALPVKMRQVFELSRKTGCSRKDIAEKMQVSEETVKSHMHHALKILKQKLGGLFFLLFF